MKIIDLLDKNSIKLDASPSGKEEALNMAIDLMDRSGKLNDKEAYRRQVFAREKESTTGIGEGIAIPHGKCAAVDRPGLAAMVIPGGVDFESLDDEPVTLMFLIAAPWRCMCRGDTQSRVHLPMWAGGGCPSHAQPAHQSRCVQMPDALWEVPRCPFPYGWRFPAWRGSDRRRRHRNRRKSGYHC